MQQKTSGSFRHTKTQVVASERGMWKLTPWNSESAQSPRLFYRQRLFGGFHVLCPQMVLCGSSRRRVVHISDSYLGIVVTTS